MWTHPVHGHRRHSISFWHVVPMASLPTRAKILKVLFPSSLIFSLLKNLRAFALFVNFGAYPLFDAFKRRSSRVRCQPM
jgi:hypothetical protein